MKTRHHHTPGYTVTASRVGITPDHCDHGHTGIDLQLHGIPCHRGALPPVINTAMPRCTLAQIVGTYLDGLTRHEGPAAATRFLEQITAARTEAATYTWTTGART